MKQILLAYDGSHFAESALGELPRMGLGEDVAIQVLNVVSTNASAEDREKGEAQLQHAVRVIQGLVPHAQVSIAQAAGSAAAEILNAAKACGADLIVLGAHGKSALERLFFGSVSAKVAAEATCSVRLCRTHREPGFQHLRLTLALDGSAGSDLALQRTLERPWPQGTGFHVISVLEPGKTDSSLQQKAAQATEQLKAQGHFAQLVILEGNPAKSLIKDAETWAPHCLILGSRGREHGSTRPLGTLATDMVLHGSGHVEVVR